MAMSENSFIQVKSSTLNDEVRQHCSEITFTGDDPMRKVHHRFMEETREEKAREDFHLVAAAEWFPHVSDPVLNPEIPASPPEFTQGR